MNFTVLKTKVSVSPLFFMLLTLLLLFDKNSIALPAMLFSFCHEIGHFLALLCAKTKPIFIKVTIFGIRMELPKNLSMDKKVLVLIFGFAVNFIMAGLFFVFGKELYGYISLLIGIFTALPMPSTDGGGVLAAVLSEISPENADKTIKAVSAVSSVSVIFVLINTAFTVKNAFLLIPITYILIMALKKTG